MLVTVCDELATIATKGIGEELHDTLFIAICSCGKVFVVVVCREVITLRSTSPSEKTKRIGAVGVEGDDSLLV